MAGVNVLVVGPVVKVMDVPLRRPVTKAVALASVPAKT